MGMVGAGVVVGASPLRTYYIHTSHNNITYHDIGRVAMYNLKISHY
jgi:hypothetical protein